jgi:hypothetical protein
MACSRMTKVCSCCACSVARSEKFRRAVNLSILDEWLAARKRWRSPDMDNGWVGCDDGIGHAVERVFGKGGSVVLLSALGQDKFAELLLNYKLQMRASGCN